MIYVVSDLHGYPIEDYWELLDKAGFCADDFLYVLGDVVDRGEEGIEYLLWLKDQKNAELILGNHEDMMRKCDFLFHPDVRRLMEKLNNDQRVNLGTWMSNGAENTVRGLFGLTQEERGEIFRYLNTLPPYRTITVGDREFVLTHSGLRDFSPAKSLDDYSLMDLIWNRPEIEDRYFDDKTTVFGHTPTFFFGEDYREEILVTDTWIDIDVGTGYGNPPVLLRLDDMETFC